MAEITWLKVGERLNKGDIILSRCKRFAIGFIGNDKFGVFLADDRNLDEKRIVQSYNIGTPVNPALSEIFARMVPTGFQVIDYLGPGPYTLDTWSRFPVGADSTCALTVSPLGSMQIMKNFDFWASPPPNIGGTPLFSSDPASILQHLEIRNFGDSANFVYRNEVNHGESFVYDTGSVGLATNPYIDKQENYPFTLARVSYNSIFPAGDDAQFYVDRLPSMAFPNSSQLPKTDSNGIEITIPETMHTKFHQTIEESLRVMHPLMDGYTLVVNQNGPATTSGKIQVDVAFQKVIIVHWTGTIRQDVKPHGWSREDQHLPSAAVTGSLVYAYDPQFTFTAVP